MQPDVSIVIPVFNRPRLVREAIESALEPAGVSTEVIVVDDASTDETWEVVRSYEPGVRAWRMAQNGGQCAANNAGLVMASGEFVKFLDSDDLLVASHLREEVRVARAAGADIVVSGWGHLDADGSRREVPAPHFDSIVDDLLAGKAVWNSAALYRRRPELRCDTSLRKLTDWAFFTAAALMANKIETAEGTAYWVREHGEGRVTTSASMITNARAHHSILRSIEDVLRRRGELTEPRRLRLAQYFYKELRVLSVHDREAFEAALAHIYELDPHFVPREEERQWWMRVLARGIGTRRALLGHSALKRLLARDS